MKPSTVILLPSISPLPFFRQRLPPRRLLIPPGGVPPVSCSRRPDTVPAPPLQATTAEYVPNAVDGVFLGLFRSKMAEEVGWDSDKPGYDGLIDVARRLMMKGTNADAKDAAVRILRALFPPLVLELYKLLVTPIGGGKIAAVMVARVTALTCQWLMGRCMVTSIDLPDGTHCQSGVFVERCKYLEESKCVGICINTCKLPTQTFFKEYMGIPLLMEPNFEDYSCQFRFGVPAPSPELDSALKEPCLEICPNAVRRKEVTRDSQTMQQCPKA
ncbi:hypothetical protein MLD38_031771 [Melastoma candidum]|uniref:Uncharacterized protein n=1 Tax=Melastoma candidum TaxID=119954 RepID=A0ACB9MQ61_9MYRT|nr:hypothetical protein MLD38_031771 [Melastoma candidum]